MKWNPSATKGLTLTMKAGDRVAINGGELIVSFIQTRGKYARLSFKAAKDISIVLEKDTCKSAEGAE